MEPKDESDSGRDNEAEQKVSQKSGDAAEGVDMFVDGEEGSSSSASSSSPPVGETSPDESSETSPAADRLDPLLRHALAITAVSVDADDIYKEKLTHTSVKWGMGPALRRNDVVLMYIPKGLVHRLGAKGGRPGFYGLYRVAADTRKPQREDFTWRHEVDLSARLALDPPITIDELRRHPVLRDWGQLRKNFRDAGRLKEPVAEREARSLWELVLNRIIPNHYSDIEAFLSGWFSDRSEPDLGDLESLRGAPSIGDEPAKIDLLGRRDLVNALAAMLDHPGQGTPFTIGLLGKWGSGKTSVMTQLEESLKPAQADEAKDDDPERLKHRRHDFVFAWFNAWEYEKTDNIGAGLAQEVVHAIRSSRSPIGRLWLQVRFAWSEHRWPFARALALAVILFALAVGAACLALAPPMFKDGLRDVVTRVFGGTAAVGLLAVGTRLGKRVRELWNHPLADELTSYLKLPDYGKHLGLIPVLRRHLRALCEARRIGRRPPGAEGCPRLVVFVDDLDRCGPESIVQTFDAIRLVMGIPGVVVIVGIDAGIAFRAVGSHYEELADLSTPSSAIARDFLGKIIQLPIRLGRPSDLGPFVRQLFVAAGDRPPERGQATETTDGSVVTANQGSGSIGEAGASEPGGLEPGSGTGPTGAGRAEPDPSPMAQEIQVELDRDMEHSPEEAGRFQGLAEDFGFDNPRQLLRLRNSYRLLKIFDLQTARRLGRERFGASLVMAGLFWQEFLHRCAPHLRRACEAALKLRTVAHVPDPEAQQITKRFLARLTGQPGWIGRLDEAGTLVRRLVLPRDLESPSVDAGGSSPPTPP